jgi:hypothetical protein
VDAPLLATQLSMTVVSVTRLRLRSVRFVPKFLLYAARSKKQAMGSGCLDAQTRKTRGLAFWTLTLWDSETSLKKFMSQAPHRVAMLRLPYWCDESAVAHWSEERAMLPSWQTAESYLKQNGRFSRLLHPSERHQKGEI